MKRKEEMIARLSCDYRKNLEQEEKLWKDWKNAMKEWEEADYADGFFCDRVEETHNAYEAQEKRVSADARFIMRLILEG